MPFWSVAPMHVILCLSLSLNHPLNLLPLIANHFETLNDDCVQHPPCSAMGCLNICVYMMSIGRMIDFPYVRFVMTYEGIQVTLGEFQQQ